MVENLIKVFAESYELDQAEKQQLSEIVYTNYMKYGVFPQKGSTFTKEEKASVDDWKAEISRRFGCLAFRKIYRDCECRISHDCHQGNNIRRKIPEAVNKICDLLNVFSCPYSSEYQMFSEQEEFENPESIGVGKDITAMLKEKEIMILEGNHTDSTFVRFMFNLIRSTAVRKMNDKNEEIIMVTDIDDKVEIASSMTGTMSDHELRQKIKVR